MLKIIATQVKSIQFNRSIMFENVDWDTVIVSAIIGAVYSLAVAIGVAFYVKYKMKPSSEKVFEGNRESETKWTFMTLERYHDDAMRIFEKFEEAFGELAKTRKELVTEIKCVPEEELKTMKPVSFKDIIQDQNKMAELKERLDWELKQMKKLTTDYQQGENIANMKQYFNYDDFVLPLFSLMKNINDYAEGLLQADLRPYSLQYAIKNAKTVIKYLKDNDLDKSSKNVKSFIERWEKAIKELSE